MEGVIMFRCATLFCSLVKTGVLPGAIALAAIPAAPALADQFVLYVFAGVRDYGGASTGVATIAHCFNFGANAIVQFNVRNNFGTVVAAVPINISQFQTSTVVTHQTVLFPEDLNLSTGIVDQGVLGIAATSPNIVCTAQVVDASAVVPNGIELHGLRLNPLPGTQE
jgi:hypothetical protein